MENVILRREEVDQNYTWDLSHIYKSQEALEKDLEEAKRLTGEIERDYKGKIKTSEDVVKSLDLLRKLYEISVKIMSYSYLKVSVDHTNADNQAKLAHVSNIQSNLSSRVSFLDNEITSLDEDILEETMEKSKENRNYIKDLLRKKAYALDSEVERVLLSLSDILDTPYDVYNSAKLADMDFGSFQVDGKEYPLSFVLFEEEYEYSRDTAVRRGAFEAFSRKIKEYENTIATAYQKQVQKEKVIADLRGFDSVIDSLLFPQKVDEELYNRQIDLIMEHLAPHMRKYAGLLQRIHKLDEMTFADLKLDVDPDFEPSISIDESRDYVVKALAPLGDEYLEAINRAFDERWIDFVQNKGKSTGAFCSSPYGVHPYILISWTEKMKEVFVLAHELGHAGHFYLAQKEQNIFDQSISRYTVESPSTMNEMLMANYLMKNIDDDRMKRWVLSTIISRTYYHNFVTHLLEAHYQREVYRIIDKGGSVQAPVLNKLKKETLEKFWGGTVTINQGAELTWMRQPHYYMGLYPYTYSAGLTIATEVSKRILDGDEKALEDWKKVLRAGGTLEPIEFAKEAGVDITTDKPLLNTIDYIGSIIDEMIELTDKIEG